LKYYEQSGIDPQNIDEAIKAGINVPMGPLELSDNN